MFANIAAKMARIITEIVEMALTGEACPGSIPQNTNSYDAPFSSVNYYILYNY
jgi:hypothetical protein